MSTLKSACRDTGAGYYVLERDVRVPVRIFMSQELFDEAEDGMFEQVRAATQYPGVRDVVITPDAHTGYVVPVGSVIATNGTLCQAPVGYDIGCGMMACRSTVDRKHGMDDKHRRQFTKLVMDRVALGVGEGGKHPVTAATFEEVVRFGARALGKDRGDRSERDFLPVDDRWKIPDVARNRGIDQLCSLGGGNHFIELQYDEDDQLWVMVHTGSRGFGHALATEFIQRGKAQAEQRGVRGSGKGPTFFEPGTPNWDGYRCAVAAAANFAIANRLLIYEAVARAFHQTFGSELELYYEISHNLVQEELVPSLGGRFWVHRKGATRAFPAGHPMLAGTPWEKTGHPILIPGSMGDRSYILTAKAGAERSLYSVNHGCGRTMSRAAARSSMTQRDVNRQMAELDVMVNAGGNVPIDESPACYKPSSEVVESVVSAGLARVTRVLTPLVSIKGAD